MGFERVRRMALLSTALIGTLAAGMAEGQAQTLFDVLFGQRQQQRVYEAPPQAAQPPAPRPPTVAPRVTGPSYYTYKTDPLVKVDFAKLSPATARSAANPALDTGTVGSTVPVQADASVETDAPAPVARVEDAETIPARVTLTIVPRVEEAQLLGVPLSGERLVRGTGETSRTAAAAPVVQANAAEETVKPFEMQASDAIAAAAADNAPRAAAAEPALLDAAALAGLQDYELLAEKEIAEALVAHYEAHPQMLWLEGEGTDGAVNAAARAALRVLGDAAGHGLEPDDYSVSMPRQADAASLSRFEMALSARVLRYARDANGGRVDPNRISGYHDFAPKEIDLPGVLASIRDSGDVAAVLAAQHPQNRQYKALRAELEMLRASTENDIVIAPDTLIRPGQTNAEFAKVLLLIERQADEAFKAEHGAVLAAHLGSEVYAQELVPVIKAAQEAAGVGTDGVIGPRTVLAIAGVSKQGRIAKVEVALEQIRWLPSDLGDRYVFLNTPAFNASYVDGGQERLSMRAIYGNNSTQTYFFQDEIQYVEFHPYWGVPRSILVNKYLPKLYSNPGYLDQSGFEVVNRNGQRIASSSVDWTRYGANPPYDVRQRPGPSNALGELKIMFPNKHAIYMHDTPDRHLFARDNRALSNGCVRLEDPRAMAAAVLGWDREQVTRRLDQPHSRENLSTKVPVYVAYFTAWPAMDGTVSYFNDVYDRDGKIREALDRIDSLRAPGV